MRVKAASTAPDGEVVRRMSSRFAFSVDLESPIAVYVQIENQILFAITAEEVSKGDTLPSVREMSGMLSVNPNTVTKAYRDLELLGLVNTRRGVGVTVTDKAFKLCKDSTHAMVRNHLRDAVAECLASGFSDGEVRKIVTDAIEKGYKPYTSSDGR